MPEKLRAHAAVGLPSASYYDPVPSQDPHGGNDHVTLTANPNYNKRNVEELFGLTDACTYLHEGI